MHLKGKGLFAKRNIKKGEVIFIERPLVCAQFLWNALYRYKGETQSAYVYVTRLIIDI